VILTLVLQNAFIDAKIFPKLQSRELFSKLNPKSGLYDILEGNGLKIHKRIQLFESH